jgi:hypothetical protein
VVAGPDSTLMQISSINQRGTTLIAEMPLQ